ncbi:MAG: DsrE/DsrF/DrsH-like family protein [Nitrospirota bacterium]
MEEEKNNVSACSTSTPSSPDRVKAEKVRKNVSVMCFSDELCQVYNALMTALSLLREGNSVDVFFGSRGINAVHREKIKTLKCLPDQPEIGEAVLKKMDEMNLPSAEDLMFFLIAEKARVWACPLNKELFDIKESDFYDGVKVADPATYYKDVVMKADMNLTF